MPQGPTIHVLDLKHLGRPRMIADFLVTGPHGRDGGAVLVETGPASTYQNLLAAMEERGFAASDLRDVLVTHIHLDHAGAAGQLAADPSFTGRIHVHEFGAPHLIDPSRLIESASRIYGREMQRLWGAILPIPAERVIPLRDGDALESAGLRFTAIETPGHARHHCCFALDAPDAPTCFVGDAAGMTVPKVTQAREQGIGYGEPGQRARGASHFINLPTPPPEFDLELWLNTIDRLEGSRFGSLYLTHFGEVRRPLPHLAAVRSALRAHTGFVLSRLGPALSAAGSAQIESSTFNDYKSWVRRRARKAGLTPEEIAVFVTESLLRMNVMGIGRYLIRRGRG